MNEPKRHHLVPRCYLKNFGIRRKKDWFVDACEKSKGVENIFEVNIKNICVQTEYYTFSKLPDDQKRFLEKFYATNIEANYTELYELLTARNQTKLSTKQRFAIITFVISLSLRTSKAGNNYNNFWNSTLDKVYGMLDVEKGIDKIQIGAGRYIDFKNNTLDQIKKEHSKENIELFNLLNFQTFYEISSRRLKDGILVEKIHPSYKLISSDNPAYFDHNIYDPTGFIKLPLDETYLLLIIPYTQEEYFDPKNISKRNLDEEWSYMEANYNNIFQIENSEKYLIGSSTNIKDALAFFTNLDSNDFYERCKALRIKTEKMLEIVEKIA
jgi:hypothetical protein